MSLTCDPSLWDFSVKKHSADRVNEELLLLLSAASALIYEEGITLLIFHITHISCNLKFKFLHFQLHLTRL